MIGLRPLLVISKRKNKFHGCTSNLIGVVKLMTWNILRCYHLFSFLLILKSGCINKHFTKHLYWFHSFVELFFFLTWKWVMSLNNRKMMRILMMRTRSNRGIDSASVLLLLQLKKQDQTIKPILKNALPLCLVISPVIFQLLIFLIWTFLFS